MRTVVATIEVGSIGVTTILDGNAPIQFTRGVKRFACDRDRELSTELREWLADFLGPSELWKRFYSGLAL